MRKAAFSFILLVLTFVAIWSCQKEIVFDPSNPAGPGSSGGSSSSNPPGWSFTGPSSSSFKGCIDTAHYNVFGGAKSLTIDGRDSAGNFLSIVLFSANGNLAATTYTAAGGSQMSFSKTTGEDYGSLTPTSISVQVTLINDTLVEANFSGTLTDPLGGGTFALTTGKLRAKIRRYNGCSLPAGGGGGAGAFTLQTSAGDCFNTDVQGLYRRGTALTATNKVVLNVMVTQQGPWSFSTTTVNGITFSGKDTFDLLGPQTITLQGTGTPAAYGNTVFPISSSGTTCSFALLVDTVANAPCTPTNNSVTFSTAGIGNFSFTTTQTQVINSNWRLGGGSIGGDIHFEFPGTTPPIAGTYRVQPVSGSMQQGDVQVYLVASSILWQASSGTAYVSVNGGKVSVTMCNVPFSGSLGGPSFNTQVSAKVTQQ